MAYNSGIPNNEGAGGNVWSSGSRGGSSGGGYSRSYDDDNSPRGGGSFGGSFGNNNSRRGGGSYGFRRQNDRGDMEILKDTIFIQNLPKNITRDEILDIFSTVGTIRTDERSGGPKIWIYKDRDTGEGNGRATVGYEDDETADKAISQYNDQHIDSINSTVRVQLAQRRSRTNDSDRGSYRGGRSHWDNNNFRQGFHSGGGGRRDNPRGGGFSDNRGDGFRGRGGDGGGSSYRDDDDHGGSYGGSRGGSFGSRGGSYRGASRGNSGASNYAPY